MLQKLKEVFCNYIKRDWTTSEKILTMIVFLFAGIILGFLQAPIKNGFAVFSNNGNGNGNGNDCEAVQDINKRNRNQQKKKVTKRCK